MKIKPLAMAISAGAIGLVSVISGISLAFLPAQVQVSRSAIIQASPSEVFAQLNSTEGFHRMNPFLDAHPGLKITRSGPDSGVGAIYQWDDNGAIGSQTIVAVTQDRAIDMQLDLGAHGRPTAKFAIEPHANGAKVSWTMTAEFGANPIGRIIGQTLEAQIGPMYEQGLAKLGRSTSLALAR